MFQGKLLLLLVSSCLAAPPKLTGQLEDPDRVSTVSPTPETGERLANLKESFLDKHQKFLGLLDFDFLNGMVSTPKIETTEEEITEKPLGGRQAQSAIFQDPESNRVSNFSPFANSSIFCFNI